MKRLPTNAINQKVPHNHMICGRNVYCDKDTRKTWINNNALVVGSSGSGKSRLFVEPAIIQADTSYVISDPKGKLYKSYSKYLISKGYKVYKADFIHPEKSIKYNPFENCKKTQDIQKMSHILTYGLVPSGSKVDPFWDESTQILLNAVTAYMVETTDPRYRKNFSCLAELICQAQKTGEEQKKPSPLSCRMKAHAVDYFARTGKESWAYKRFCEVNTAPYRTMNTICTCSLAKFSQFDTEELRNMLSENELDFTELGREKVAVFVEVSDTDRCMDALVNLFYTQLMNTLCSYADEECPDNCLPMPVQFILDDFATNARIDNFENMISNIRSRNISAMLMVQSESQLYAGYGVSASTIVNNCGTYIYLGGVDPEMARIVGTRVNLPTSTILNMPVNMSYVCRRGQEPIYCEHFDLEWFKDEMGVVYGKPCTKKRGSKAKTEELDMDK